MRTIGVDKASKDLVDLIVQENPIDEDIGIMDKNGNLLGVVITPQAYEFFLEKMEEEEDRIDRETVSDFHKSGEKNQ